MWNDVQDLISNRCENLIYQLNFFQYFKFSLTFKGVISLPCANVGTSAYVCLTLLYSIIRLTYSDSLVVANH